MKLDEKYKQKAEKKMLREEETKKNYAIIKVCTELMAELNEEDKQKPEDEKEDIISDIQEILKKIKELIQSVNRL